MTDDRLRGRALREVAHPRCIACSPRAAPGLKLEFHELPDGAVVCQFTGDSFCEGYPGRLHGGVVSTIIDAAMTNCLFAHGYQAVTAELAVRFVKPALIGRPTSTRARIAKDMHPLYLMEAELTQDGLTRATATAKFILAFDQAR